MDLADRKIPFLLNYAQCQLLLGNFYDAIEQCSQVLLRDPRNNFRKTIIIFSKMSVWLILIHRLGNVKALYRRGIAHVKVWNPEEAKRDLQVCIHLANSLIT